jgi:alpha-galactosidase
MRRRSLLGAGAIAAAWGTLRRAARAAVPTHESASASWTLSHGPARYVVRLDGAAIIVDCYGPDAPPRDAALLAGAAPAAAAMLIAGREEQAVAWEVGIAYQPDPRTLRLAITAVGAPLVADLLFAIDPATGILRRETEIRHDGVGPDVEIAATLGFWFHVHEPIGHLHYLAGAWAHETQLRRGVGDAALRMDSRVGKTGFGFQPYVALRCAAATYLCEIFWSGNWALEVTPQAGGGAVVAGGLNNWRFRCRLGAAVDTLPLPSVLFARVAGEINTATQRLHDYRRAHRPDPDRAIPVQFNSWYPYLGDPTAQSMLPLVPVARRLGCEAFVVDAGWYRTDQGDTDADWTERTGDWRTSLLRFPKGLREVSAHCHENGLKFGLWFEPEVIGSLSAVRRDHPEWLHHVDGRAPEPSARAILNLGVPAARRHAFERVTRILSTVGVDWMKWDFNADFGAGGWAPGLPAALTDQDPLVAHYIGLYRLQDAIRRWFPELILEMCASGGGRMDGELLAHAHVNWMSDQPGPLQKLAIHFGCQFAHPAVACNDWLIEWPPGTIAGYQDEYKGGIDERGDLAFRLRVAMLGSFGVSARIDRWPDTDFALAAQHIALYRDRLRAIIHEGDQYVLTRAPPPDGDGDWAAIWYAAKDGLQGVLFVFRLGGAAASRPFELAGLAANRTYRARFFSGATSELTGQALTEGLAVTIPGNFQSELCLVEAI